MSVQDLQTSYSGSKGPLFRLAFKTGVLTVLTLGLYRFWMKTRMRRYYWSAIRPGGVRRWNMSANRWRNCWGSSSPW